MSLHVNARFLILSLLCLLHATVKAEDRRSPAPSATRTVALIPQPSHLEMHSGRFTLNAHTALICQDGPLADYFNDHIERICGFRLPVSHHTPHTNYIALQPSENKNPEAYSLRITPHHIQIRGATHTALFYGLQTLFQVMPASIYAEKGEPLHDALPIDALSIEDAPRFAYRGAMLDVSRTFFDKATVMQFIDRLARHKINRLHWHLADDNGWRIEIKRYPELTERGAWRGPGEALAPSYGSGQRRYGGYYTQEDIREIVRYAAFRGIEIIPEIDLPGHSEALIATHPEAFCSIAASDDDPGQHNVLCAAREENYALIADILHEVAELFPSRFIHLGGDEVSYRYWKNCPQCTALMKERGFTRLNQLFGHVVGRLEKLIHAAGKQAAFWDEAMLCDSLSPTTQLYGWHDLATCGKSLKRGMPTVFLPASYCYIDMKQSPEAFGHTWAGMVNTRRLYSLEPLQLPLSPAEDTLVRGVEASLWSELLVQGGSYLDYQTFPRLCTLAEVGWSTRKDRNWTDFAERLTLHLQRLEAMGIAFYLSAPHVTYKKGIISATSPVPNTEIRYTIDGSEPTCASPCYRSTIQDTLPERYRFRNFGYRTASSSVTAVGYLNTELSPAQTRTLTLPLAEYIDRNGIWYVKIMPNEPELRISRMDVLGADTTYTIIRNGQEVNPFADLRLYIDEKNRNADLRITLTNKSAQSNPVTLSLRPSPYLEPATTFSSSLPFSSKFPARSAVDYNMRTVSRSSAPCKKGDYMLYTFDEPITVRAIEVKTGLAYIARYIITQGAVECSGDGISFREICPLDDFGRAIVHPDGPIKALRIRIDAPNGEAIVATQDLYIFPLE